MGLGVAESLPLAGHSQQLLGHRQTQQLSVNQRRFAARSVRPRPAQRRQDMIIEFYIQCRQDGDEVVAHNSVLAPSAHLPVHRQASRSMGLAHLDRRVRFVTSVAREPGTWQLGHHLVQIVEHRMQVRGQLTQLAAARQPPLSRARSTRGPWSVRAAKKAMRSSVSSTGCVLIINVGG